MVDVTAIARADDDGLHLETTAAATEAQSPAVASEEVAMPERVQEPTTFIPAAGVGGPIYADPPAAPGRYPDDSSFVEMAPIDPPPVEIFSNLGPNEVLLGDDTHAISSDDHKVGKVVALTLGDRQVVEASPSPKASSSRSEPTFPGQHRRVRNRRNPPHPHQSPSRIPLTGSPQLHEVDHGPKGRCLPRSIGAGR